MNLRHNVLVSPLSYEGEFRRLPVVVVALAQESLDVVGVVPPPILEYVPLTQVRSVVDDLSKLAGPNINSAGVNPVVECVVVFIIRFTNGTAFDHLCVMRLSKTYARKCRKTSLLALSTIAFSSWL
jgi:hypothetical protein